MASDLYSRVVRPLAFSLRPERAHEVGKTLYRRERLWQAVRRPSDDDPRLRTMLGPIELQNPVGLAAGFDKNSEMIATMRALGFGFSIPGSIRPVPAGDNPRPNIVRYVEQQSLVNCTGLPSRGAEYSAKRLAAVPARVRAGMAVIPSIQGFTVEDYVVCLRHVQPVADAVEIPLFCPNEKYEALNFLDPGTLRELLAALNALKTRPFFVKIRNYHDDVERENRLELIAICRQFGVDGVTLPGSMTVAEPALSLGRGNLTGNRVFGNTLRNIRDVRSLVGDSMAVKALGGISSADDAFRAISAGATSVELLTGLVYEGWDVARRIKRGLVALLEREGIANVDELRGSGATTSLAA